MIVYRIAQCDYINDLSGTGARLYGGRWNSEGKGMLYTTSSRSLAVLEVLVHLPPLLIPDDYCAVEIEIPTDDMLVVTADELPDGWQDIGAITKTKLMGDMFLKKREHLVMRVPSSIIPAEFNYLVNPAHPAIADVKIKSRQPFDFDERLFFKS